MNAFIPSVTRNNADIFEDRMREALPHSSPSVIEHALRDAMRFVEKQAEYAALDMAHINNATSTAMHAFIEMCRRLREAEAQLKKAREWAISDVVTAETEFGDGYRECQRDLRDKLGVKPEES